MLDLQQLLMIVDVLRINESGAHINVPLFCEKFLDLSEVITFEGTQWLPGDLSIARALPLDQEERLKGQTIELSNFLLQRISGSVSLLVHFVEVVAKNVKGIILVTFLGLIFFEQAW